MSATSVYQKYFPEIDYAAVGKRIRLLRKQQRMTQTALASQAGLSTSFCGHIERGTRIPSVETLYHLSIALDTTVDALLTGLPSLAAPRGGNMNTRMRILNDIMRVLNENADMWLPEE